MKKRLVNCFVGPENFSNPALVVEHFEGSAAEKQQFAKQENAPVTVFLRRDNIPEVEFYYPSKPTTLCVHGALAAAYICMKESADEKCVLATTSAQLRIRKINNRFFILLSQQQAPEMLPFKLQKLCLAALNLTVDDLAENLPFAKASVGSSKIFVPLKNRALLASVKPSMKKIISMSGALNGNGVYVYAPNDNNEYFYARNFNPASGQDEDAATGVAVGGLASLLKKNMRVLQGADQLCELHAQFLSANEIWVGGVIEAAKHF